MSIIKNAHDSRKLSDSYIDISEYEIRLAVSIDKACRMGQYQTEIQVPQEVQDRIAGQLRSQGYTVCLGTSNKIFSVRLIISW